MVNNKQQVLEVLKKNSSKLLILGVKRIGLFGSFVTGEQTDKSDIDLLVEFSNPDEKSLFDLLDLKQDLENLTGRKIDLVERGSIKNPYREKEIAATARLIYAA